MLSNAQLTTLGNHIRANQNQPVVDALAVGNLGGIREWYNQAASPDFSMFRNFVTNMEVKDTLDWTEHLALSQIELTVFRSLTEDGGFNPIQENVRDGLAAIFSGPQQVNTRTAILNIASKLATNFEQLYAVAGTGTAGGNGSAADEAAVPGKDADGNDIIRDVTTSEIDLALEITAT